MQFPRPPEKQARAECLRRWINWINGRKESRVRYPGNFSNDTGAFSTQRGLQLPTVQAPESQAKVRDFVKAITGKEPSPDEMIGAMADATVTEISRLRSLLKS
jgi:hypothetical protein